MYYFIGSINSTYLVIINEKKIYIYVKIIIVYTFTIGHQITIKNIQVFLQIEMYFSEITDVMTNEKKHVFLNK